MRIEELQAIWETQTERPVFAVNDFGLHMELYRNRDQARRRLFWGGYFPFFVGSLCVAPCLAVVFLSWVLQSPAERFPLNAWDGLVSLVAALAVVLFAWLMYTSRRKHEKAQSVFAPSLRQEVERGIAQLDFEIRTAASPLRWRNLALFSLVAILLLWETGRLNGDPLPWELLGISGGVVVAGFVAQVRASRQAKEKLLQHRRALEALRAKLDESPTAS